MLIKIVSLIFISIILSPKRFVQLALFMHPSSSVWLSQSSSTSLHVSGGEDAQLPSEQKEPIEAGSLFVVEAGHDAKLPVQLENVLVRAHLPLQAHASEPEQTVDEGFNVLVEISQQSPEVHWTQVPPEQ